MKNQAGEIDERVVDTCQVEMHERRRRPARRRYCSQP
jgi:hypothetical protein